MNYVTTAVLHPTRFCTICVFAFLLLVTSACTTVLPAADESASSNAETAAGDVEESGITQLPKNGDGYVDISVEQLAGMMEDKSFTLVNVHIPYEGELPQTDAFIAYDEIAEHTDELPPKDAPIVLYCRSGSMSTQAANVLADMGYEQVMEVDGGFNAWKAAGYEFIDQR